ncbi:hypothetical protein GP486_004109 [Trichoglossum hirsutum]|uniref:Uncharacterized protein n=1 Tax=Trichoglossum hirsutum TaxID=265104 RepID=A0A9P8LBT9_9PEZI|nr:hypothetical protein GP486_004109 [Trichoglossum hirsutum]
MDDGHRRKRRKDYLPWCRDSSTASPPPHQSLFGELDPQLEDILDLESGDIWSNGSLFAVDISESQPTRRETCNTSSNKKRSHGRAFPNSDSVGGLGQDLGFDPTMQEWLFNKFPVQFASVPLLENRQVDLSTPNPFADGSIVRHPHLRQMTKTLPEDGAVNGYIKFRLRLSHDEDESSETPQSRSFNQRSMAVHHRHMPDLPGNNNVPPLPPHFGRGCKLDSIDNKLFKFYLVAFCSGRTLLSNSNFWLLDIAPMAAGSECVKHALLAFAAGYVLDYLPNEKLQARANHHYGRAVDLLSKALRDPETYEVNKGDSVVSAIILLLSDDVVNYELRRPKDLEPRWRGGAAIAKSILDSSDPGYRYWNPVNVQSTSARVSNANRVAYVDILAQPVTPLKIEDTDRLYSWLLTGTEKEIRKIHGGTGLCPKLLHILAQITHFSARMREVKTPDSIIIPLGAEKIEKILDGFRQWSDLSEGYASVEALLDSCGEGKVECPTKITELTGEAWVAAAQIYLHCRFYR